MKLSTTQKIILTIILTTPSALRAADYYWDQNGDAADFGDGSGQWGTDAFWTEDTSGAFATPAGGVLVTLPDDTVTVNQGRVANATMSVTGNVQVRTLFGAASNGATHSYIDNSGGGSIHLFGVGPATPAINLRANDGNYHFGAPVVFEQAEASEVYIGGNSAGGVNGHIELSGGVSSVNEISLFFRKQGNLDISGDMALKGSITNLQPQPGNPGKRQHFGIASVIPATVTDVTQSGGDSTTMILSAADNLYSGKTTVNSGILMIMTDTSLPATTDVYLNTSPVVGNGYGTKIDLANSGTNFVNGLFIDGIAQAQGTWGASGSGATNINDTFFKGNGTITVGPGPAPVNFAISSLSVADGMVTLTWNSRENVTYIIRYSLDLANWAADLEDKIEPGPEGETTRTYDLSEYGLDTETKWFLRVEEE